MKKILFILITSLLFASCENKNDDTSEDIESSQEEEFLGSTVGYEESGKLILTVSGKELVNSFNSYSKKFNLGYKAVSNIIEEIDGKNYVRFFNEDGSVSTVALINKLSNLSKSSTPITTIGSTVCTTQACADCCGCIPNGDYCTHCQVDVLDCKRTTSG